LRGQDPAESRDISRFIDDDGTPYLIFEDRPYGFRIATLSAGYQEVCLIPLHLEGGLGIDRMASESQQARYAGVGAVLK